MHKYSRSVDLVLTSPMSQRSPKTEFAWRNGGQNTANNKRFNDRRYGRTGDRTVPTERRELAKLSQFFTNFDPVWILIFLNALGRFGGTRGGHLELLDQVEASYIRRGRPSSQGNHPPLQPTPGGLPLLPSPPSPPSTPPHHPFSRKAWDEEAKTSTSTPSSSTPP